MKPALEKYSVTIIAFILDIGRRKEAGNGQFLEKRRQQYTDRKAR